MQRQEAEPLLLAAQRAAEWCRSKLEMRTGAGGFGKEHEYRDSERSGLHIAHSMAVCEIARLQAFLK